MSAAACLKPVRIGTHTLPYGLILAPMAGVTDGPFRQLCRQWGAALCVSEMLTSDSRLWDTPKSRFRLDHSTESGLRSVQIVGWDPQMMADAAQQNVERGAQIIDINMGCPAKKVCSRLAGSALLQDELLVARILEAVVRAVPVPVTLKTRTGWCRAERNGVRIARIAEACGIQALAMHGRTREDKYEGLAEYDTIAAVKQAVQIPVFANGDIDSAEKARQVLTYTRADGIMLGRGALGRPWLFQEILSALTASEVLVTGVTVDNAGIRKAAAPGSSAWWQMQADTALAHIAALYAFYGGARGVKFARKHMAWYLAGWPDSEAFRTAFNRLESEQDQYRLAGVFFADRLQGEAFSQ